MIFAKFVTCYEQKKVTNRVLKLPWVPAVALTILWSGLKVVAYFFPMKFPLHVVSKATDSLTTFSNVPHTYLNQDPYLWTICKA